MTPFHNSKSKGLYDGSNMHLNYYPWGEWRVWRSKDGITYWSATTTSPSVAEYLYAFED